MKIGDIEWEPARPKAREADLYQLTRMTGGQLPESLRDFLKLTNGGRPAKPAAFPLFRPKERDLTTLNEMYSVTHGGIGSTIQRMSKLLPVLTENGLLPIGRDGFNGQLCVNLKDGTIHFFEWKPAPDPSGIETPFFVTGSFEEFIDALEPVQE